MILTYLLKARYNNIHSSADLLGYQLHYGSSYAEGATMYANALSMWWLKFDIKFGNIFYSKEKMRAWPLPF